MSKPNPKSKDNSNPSTLLPEKPEIPFFLESPVNLTPKPTMILTFLPPPLSIEEQP